MQENTRRKRNAGPPPEPNLIDRAIGYFAPRVAARRLVARHQLALVGGYNGARKDKASMAGWRTRAGSPESDIIADLPMLRDRCADLERNAPVAAAVINTQCIHVVGTGLACTPHLDAEFLRIAPEQAKAWQDDTKRRFKAWATSVDCDLARTLNFYGLQDQALRGALSRGDVFALTPRVQRQGGRPTLAIQMVEADRVGNPAASPNSATLTEGVEHSAATGEPVRYHVLDSHPGDLRAGARSGTWVGARGDKTGRRNVLHLFRQQRPGQRRGVPVLAPVIEPIKQVTRYTEAELEAAVVSGLFAVFLRMDPTAFQDLFDEDAQGAYINRASSWSGEMEAGKAINLLPGEEPVPSNPGRPNEQFDPFVASCFKQIGMAIGMPYEVLTMAFQSSYSAAKGALLTAWRFFMSHRDWLASYFCQPVYELWLADEVAEGRIAAPGFFADPVLRAAWCNAVWVGDGPGSLDPEREVRAAQARVNMGISTLQAESLLLDGVDWQTKHAQQVEENAARRAAGLKVPGAEDAPPAPAAAPDGQDGKDGQDGDGGQQGGPAAPPAPPGGGQGGQRRPARAGSTQAAGGPSAYEETPLTAALIALASREPQPQPLHITVEGATIHNTPPAVHVAAPEVHVEVDALMPEVAAPPVHVHVDPTPIHVDVPPAPVLAQQSGGKQDRPWPIRTVIKERDASGRADVIETTPIDE